MYTHTTLCLSSQKLTTSYPKGTTQKRQQPIIVLLCNEAIAQKSSYVSIALIARDPVSPGAQSPERLVSVKLSSTEKFGKTWAASAGKLDAAPLFAPHPDCIFKQKSRGTQVNGLNWLPLENKLFDCCPPPPIIT